MSEPDTSNHIRVDEADACWHCGEPTHWVELAFEARLCPGLCTEAKWKELHDAYFGK